MIAALLGLNAIMGFPRWPRPRRDDLPATHADLLVLLDLGGSALLGAYDRATWRRHSFRVLPYSECLALGLRGDPLQEELRISGTLFGRKIERLHTDAAGRIVSVRLARRVER